MKRLIGWLISWLLLWIFPLYLHAQVPIWNAVIKAATTPATKVVSPPVLNAPSSAQQLIPGSATNLQILGGQAVPLTPAQLNQLQNAASGGAASATQATSAGLQTPIVKPIVVAGYAGLLRSYDAMHIAGVELTKAFDLALQPYIRSGQQELSQSDMDAIKLVMETQNAATVQTYLTKLHIFKMELDASFRKTPSLPTNASGYDATQLMVLAALDLEYNFDTSIDGGPIFRPLLLNVSPECNNYIVSKQSLYQYVKGVIDNTPKSKKLAVAALGDLARIGHCLRGSELMELHTTFIDSLNATTDKLRSRGFGAFIDDFVWHYTQIMILFSDLGKLYGERDDVVRHLSSNKQAIKRSFTKNGFPLGQLYTPSWKTGKLVGHPTRQVFGGFTSNCGDVNLDALMNSFDMTSIQLGNCPYEWEFNRCDKALSGSGQEYHYECPAFPCQTAASTTKAGAPAKPGAPARPGVGGVAGGAAVGNTGAGATATPAAMSALNPATSMMNNITQQLQINWPNMTNVDLNNLKNQDCLGSTDYPLQLMTPTGNCMPLFANMGGTVTPHDQYLACLNPSSGGADKYLTGSGPLLGMPAGDDCRRRAGKTPADTTGPAESQPSTGAGAGGTTAGAGTVGSTGTGGGTVEPVSTWWNPFTWFSAPKTEVQIAEEAAAAAKKAAADAQAALDALNNPSQLGQGQRALSQATDSDQPQNELQRAKDRAQDALDAANNRYADAVWRLNRLKGGGAYDCAELGCGSSCPGGVDQLSKAAQCTTEFLDAVLYDAGGSCKTCGDKVGRYGEGSTWGYETKDTGLEGCYGSGQVAPISTSASAACGGLVNCVNPQFSGCSCSASTGGTVELVPGTNCMCAPIDMNSLARSGVVDANHSCDCGGDLQQPLVPLPGQDGGGIPGGGGGGGGPPL